MSEVVKLSEGRLITEAGEWIPLTALQGDVVDPTFDDLRVDSLGVGKAADGTSGRIVAAGSVLSEGDLYARQAAASQVHIGSLSEGAGIAFGSAETERLVRSGSNVLSVVAADLLITAASRGLFIAGGGAGNRAFATNQGGAHYAFAIFQDGRHQWGSGSAVADVSVGRPSAGVFTIANADALTGVTRTTFTGATIERHYQNEAEYRWAIDQDAGGSGKPGIKLGAGGSTAPSVNLYFQGADILQTDDTFRAVGSVDAVGGVTVFSSSTFGTPLAGLTADGPRWYSAGLEQTTVGAAGAGSALPATPTKYLKIKDSAGTTLVIPAYAAS